MTSTVSDRPTTGAWLQAERHTTRLLLLDGWRHFQFTSSANAHDLVEPLLGQPRRDRPKGRGVLEDRLPGPHPADRGCVRRTRDPHEHGLPAGARHGAAAARAGEESAVVREALPGHFRLDDLHRSVAGDTHGREGAGHEALQGGCESPSPLVLLAHSMLREFAQSTKIDCCRQ